MPALGYNAATYIAEFRRLVTTSHLATAHPRFTDQSCLALINDGFNTIADELRWYRQKQRTQDIASGTATYNVPGDCRGTDFQVYRNPQPAASEGLKVELHRLTREEEILLYNVDDLPSGVPKVYTTLDQGRRFQSLSIAFHNPRKIALIPKPNYNGTDGLTFIYHGYSDPLHRAYNPGAANTCSVTAGTASATITDAGSLIVVGDEFGVKREVQGDRTTSVSTTEMPTVWYRIQTVTTNGTVIVLEDTTLLADQLGIQEQTDSTAHFMTGQVHEMEMEFPGKLGWSPVYFALSNHFDTLNPQLSDRYFKKGLDRISTRQLADGKIVPDEPLATALPDTVSPPPTPVGV